MTFIRLEFSGDTEEKFKTNLEANLLSSSLFEIFFYL